MMNKNSLRHRIMAVRFAIWDLHLYLDTHCDDEEAARQLEKYMEKYSSMIDEYVCKYGPITFSQGTATAWINCPFPWENTGSDS